MYSVTVRGHMMIAHSLKGDVFGPAQALHGATYVVDVEMRRAALDTNGIVVDIGRATDVLNAILGELSYRNLDDVSGFAGRNTTTEFLAYTVFERFAAAVHAGRLGPGGRSLTSIRVTLHESHLASASFDAPLGTA